MKISQVKRDLQTITSTLNKLQTHRENLIQNPSNMFIETAEIAICKERLDEAFANIESESLYKIVAQVQKRKTKRLAKKLKVKKKRGQVTSIKACQDELPESSTFVPEQLTLSSLNKRKIRSAKHYVASIDCLVSLHQLKSGGDFCKLKEYFHTVKSIWQSAAHIIHEDLNISLGKNWDKVLFGGKAEVEIVPSFEEFAQRRFIWDSYLDNSNGSHIPIGWVYAKEDARSEWKQFLQLT